MCLSYFLFALPKSTKGLGLYVCNMSGRWAFDWQGGESFLLLCKAERPKNWDKKDHVFLNLKVCWIPLRYPCQLWAWRGDLPAETTTWSWHFLLGEGIHQLRVTAATTIASADRRMQGVLFSCDWSHLGSVDCCRRFCFFVHGYWQEVLFFQTCVSFFAHWSVKSFGTIMAKVFFQQRRFQGGSRKTGSNWPVYLINCLEDPKPAEGPLHNWGVWHREHSPDTLCILCRGTRLKSLPMLQWFRQEKNHTLWCCRPWVLVYRWEQYGAEGDINFKIL